MTFSRRTAQETFEPSPPLKTCPQANAEATDAFLAQATDEELAEHLWLLRQLYVRQNEHCELILRAISKATKVAEARRG